MPDYGRQVLTPTIGYPLEVLWTHDHSTRWKAIGLSLDWTTVVAVSGSPVALNDGNKIPVGTQYLRYGQILAIITATGLYGPADTTANDGRQTLVRGKCFILNTTLVNGGVLPGWLAPQTNHPGVFDGGIVRKDLLLIGGTNQPTVSNFEAAFPAITYAQS